MSKSRTALDLAFEAPEIGAKLHQWLYEQIRSAIFDGRLKRGAKLPPTRDLAKHYGLSRGTAVAAFDLLKSEGYLEGRMGGGRMSTRNCRKTSRPRSVAERSR